MPQLNDAALRLGVAYGGLDRVDDAIVVLQAQAKLVPQDLRIQAALGLAFREAKDMRKPRSVSESCTARAR